MHENGYKRDTRREESVYRDITLTDYGTIRKDNELPKHVISPYEMEDVGPAQ